MADWNAAKKHVDDVKKLDPKGGDNLSKEVSEVMAVLCQLQRMLSYNNLIEDANSVLVRVYKIVDADAEVSEDVWCTRPGTGCRNKAADGHTWGACAGSAE